MAVVIKSVPTNMVPSNVHANEAIVFTAKGVVILTNALSRARAITQMVFVKIRLGVINVLVKLDIDCFLIKRLA